MWQERQRTKPERLNTFCLKQKSLRNRERNVHSDYKIPPRDNVREEGNYSESPCRQGNGLRRGTPTFEADINKNVPLHQEFWTLGWLCSAQCPHHRCCSGAQTQLEKAGRAASSPSAGAIWIMLSPGCTDISVISEWECKATDSCYRRTGFMDQGCLITVQAWREKVILSFSSSRSSSYCRSSPLSSTAQKL